MPRLADLAPMPTHMFVPTTTLLPSSDDARVELKFKDVATSVRRGRGVKLSEAEIRKAVESHYPPVTLDMAAAISGYARSTLKRLLSEGRFKNSAKRKKPVLFWRDRFIQELMQG